MDQMQPIPDGPIEITVSEPFSYDLVTADDDDWLAEFFWKTYRRHHPDTVQPAFEDSAAALRYFEGVVTPWTYHHPAEVGEAWGELFVLLDAEGRALIDKGFHARLLNYYDRFATHFRRVNSVEPQAVGAPQALIFWLWAPIFRWLMAEPRSPPLTRVVLGALMIAEEILFSIILPLGIYYLGISVGLNPSHARTWSAAFLLWGTLAFGEAHDRKVFFDGQNLSINGNMDAAGQRALALRGFIYRLPLFIFLCLPWNFAGWGAAAAILLHVIDGQILAPARLRREKLRLADFMETYLVSAEQETPLNPLEKKWFEQMRGVELDQRVRKLGLRISMLSPDQWEDFLKQAELGGAEIKSKASITTWAALLIDYFGAGASFVRTHRMPDQDLLVPATLSNRESVKALRLKMPHERQIYLWVSASERDDFEKWVQQFPEWSGNVVVLSGKEPFTIAQEQLRLSSSSMEEAVRAVLDDKKYGAQKDRLGIGVFENVV